MRYATRLLMFVFVCGSQWAGTVCRGDENGALQVGAVVPDFRCLDERGNIWDSRDHVGKQVVVVYFYPSDFAFCSTGQAKRYRDSQRTLADHGVEVVGISCDTVLAHQLFKDTYQIKHSLLADVNGYVACQFGMSLRNGGKAMVKDADGKEILDADGQAMSIPRNVTGVRWTFVIDKSGRVIYRETNVSPAKDCQDVLEFLCNR